MPQIASYGSWSSPITTDLLVERAVGLADVVPDGDDLYWVERRATEGGRQAIVRREPDGTTSEVLPDGFSARTLVHEYGGLSFAVRNGTVFFANLADQRLYRVDRGADPVPISPEPPEPGALRYAAPAVDPDGRFVVCVRERHLGATVENDLVALAAQPAGDEPAVQVIASGHDFYGTPALAPEGRKVAWCSWDHPNMPWDGTELWESELGPSGAPGSVRQVAGGTEESITQPRYADDGTLLYVSDRTGWWNLYADEDTPGDRALAPADAEFASPDWVFGLASYAPLAGGRIVAVRSCGGQSQLGLIERPPAAPAEPAGSAEPAGFTPVASRFSEFASIHPYQDGIVAIAASPSEPPTVVTVAIPSGALEVIRRSREVTIDAAYFSRPRPLEFDGAAGKTHALVYPPANPDFAAPEGEQPPLIVAVHGGPTSAVSSALSYELQYWTSRGFCVAAVNYSGSSGYGRAYRKRLQGNWGVLDVSDCEDAARALVAAGEVDPRRLLIHGGSAGGYAVLCAAAFGKAFVAGASYFGVADAGALARDTHKFESRYLDGLIGPWPEARDVYEARSPAFHTDKLHIPLILFQGLEDKVVPPSQAEMMAEALRTSGLPVAYLAYEGEQHGFRRAENIKRTAEAELYFYGRVLGFDPADDVEPVEIENAGSLPLASSS